MSSETPTQEQLAIVYQCMVAVGQGTAGYRVSRKTCEAVAKYCLGHLQGRPERVEGWGKADYGTQALARLRVIGQLAAHLACQGGCTVVGPEHFKDAARTVEETNRRIAKKWKQDKGGKKPSPDDPAIQDHSTWCEEPPEEAP